jgi:hypothetical protein
VRRPFRSLPGRRWRHRRSDINGKMQTPRGPAWFDPTMGSSTNDAAFAIP